MLGKECADGLKAGNGGESECSSCFRRQSREFPSGRIRSGWFELSFGLFYCPRKNCPQSSVDHSCHHQASRQRVSTPPANNTSSSLRLGIVCEPSYPRLYRLGDAETTESHSTRIDARQDRVVCRYVDKTNWSIISVCFGDCLCSRADDSKIFCTRIQTPHVFRFAPR